jgi:DNA polymerase III subunit delta'
VSSAGKPPGGPLRGLLPWLQPILERVLEQQRGHALLVQGPAGVGQFDFALVLAGAWLCEGTGRTRGGLPLAAQGVVGACGACPACHLVAARSHPDLRVLVPEAQAEALGWADADDAPAPAEATGSKKRQPSKDIRVEQVRAAVQFSALTQSRGRHKVVLIFPAERMNAVASNTLLKTLEEPPPGQRFILATQAPQRLLPTLRSRCQATTLPTPSADQAAHWLGQQAGVPPGQGAETLLAAAGGFPLLAREWAEAGLDPAAWAALPQALRKGDPSPLQGWTAARAVDALQRLCHDALVVSVGGAPRFFRQLPALGPRHTRLLLQWAEDLTRVARHAEHPWHAPLLIEALVTKGQQALA